jgi:hypothetical protein
MPKLVFNPVFLKPPVFIVAICDAMLFYLFATMENFPVLTFLIGLVLINGIGLGAIYKSLYIVSTDEKEINITHAINSADSITVYFNDITEIKILFVHNIGHKIFFYKNGSLLYDRNISGLYVFKIQELEKHVERVMKGEGYGG